MTSRRTWFLTLLASMGCSDKAAPIAESTQGLSTCSISDAGTSVGCDSPPGPCYEATGTCVALGVTSGLTGYWSFDSTTISGEKVHDQTANGNDGTLAGTTPPTIVAGKVGEAVSLD